MTIAADDLMQSAVRRWKLGIVRHAYAITYFLFRIKIIGSAKIVFRSRAIDGGELFVSIHKKFNFSLTPPAVVMHTPGQVSSYVLSSSRDIIHDGKHLFVLDRVGALELRVKIGGILRHIGKGVIHLIKDSHFFDVNILKRYLTFLSKRHHPVAVERTAWIHANRKRI